MKNQKCDVLYLFAFNFHMVFFFLKFIPLFSRNSLIYSKMPKELHKREVIRRTRLKSRRNIIRSFCVYRNVKLSESLKGISMDCEETNIYIHYEALSTRMPDFLFSWTFQFTMLIFIGNFHLQKYCIWSKASLARCSVKKELVIKSIWEHSPSPIFVWTWEMIERKMLKTLSIISHGIPVVKAHEKNSV